jgi:hypothetical protein
MLLPSPNLKASITCPHLLEPRAMAEILKKKINLMSEIKFKKMLG